MTRYSPCPNPLPVRSGSTSASPASVVAARPRVAIWGPRHAQLEWRGSTAPVRTLPLVVQAVSAMLYWAMVDRARTRPVPTGKPIALRAACVRPRRAKRW